jgi:hypothetical protein
VGVGTFTDQLSRPSIQWAGHHNALNTRQWVKAKRTSRTLKELNMQMSYWRFAAMIATSTVIMFGLMYLNTYALEHVLWSETRMWMALLMGATMAVVMLLFMLNMYPKKKLNAGILRNL